MVVVEVGRQRGAGELVDEGREACRDVGVAEMAAHDAAVLVLD